MAIAGTNLPWPKAFPGSGPTGMVVAVRCRRRCRTALDAGIHVAAVVVADVGTSSLRSNIPDRQPKPMSVVPPSPPGRRRASHFTFLSFDLDRRGDAGGDRGGIAKQRMNPRNLPRRFRVWRREDFQATGGIGRDQITARAAFIAASIAKRAPASFAAALTGAMPRVQ